MSAHPIIKIRAAHANYGKEKSWDMLMMVTKRVSTLAKIGESHLFYVKNKYEYHD